MDMNWVVAQCARRRGHRRTGRSAGADDRGRRYGRIGLKGRLSRQGLLSCGVAIPAQLRLTRLDMAVLVDAWPEWVHPHPRLATPTVRVLDGTASAPERAELGRLWQQRPHRILLEEAEAVVDVHTHT